MAKKPTTAKKTVKKEPAKKASAAAKKAVKPAAPKKTVSKAAPKPAAKKAAPAKKAPVKKVVAPKPAVKKAAPVKHAVKAPAAPKVTAHAEVPVQETAKPKRVPTQTRYSKAELEHFKQIILSRQTEIMDQLQNLRDQVLDPTTGEYINENSPYSLHMAEQGTDAMEREKIYLYAQRENKFLGYLEDALKRIEAGTYGLCIECIDDPKFLCETCPLIPKARLEAVPHSQLCVEIKNRQEKHKK